MQQLFANIALPVSINQLFTYSLPPGLLQSACPGVRVVVPFGKRTMVGFLVELQPQTSVKNVRPVYDILDAEPLLSSDLLQLSRWISEYYLAPWGEVLKSALVPGTSTPGKRTVSLGGASAAIDLATFDNAPVQQTILREVNARKRVSISHLQKLTNTKSIHSTLNTLAQRGLITIHDAKPDKGPAIKFEKAIELSSEDRKRWEEWIQHPDQHKKRAARQVAAVHRLMAIDDEAVPLTQFLKETRLPLSVIRTLIRKDIIRLGQKEVIRTNSYELYPSSLGAQDIVLNSYQQTALKSLRSAMNARTFTTFLLHGVTGSGKTQVYIEAIREALSRGKTAIVLVPEIALTPQIVRRFIFHFGENVVTLHSRMSQGERYDAWRLTREGKYSIVIGPRSAVFAPLSNIGLIVVDEEQEPSYKQFDQTPRYHARDVAIMRGCFSNAVVVLGSATPSFESFTNACEGKYRLLELPERVDTAKLPHVEIVDMTDERKRKLAAFRQERLAAFKQDAAKARAEQVKFELGSLSDLLVSKIHHRIAKREGIILLQNRRGFATFVECPDCGYVELCDHCNISLTYHQTKKHLRCHYCGFVKRPPDVCPKCQSAEINYRGFGTQRVEEELAHHFPTARIIRMDLDTTTRRGAHDEMLRSFSEGEADILLGTQMVAKGLDFSRVTLVGVISADTQMLLPDFRSAERTFQLLTQVAGRAGRSALAGEVIIQTCQPQHYALYHVLTHDFKAFYDEERRFRAELHYPPFSRLALIEFRGQREDDVVKHATTFANMLKEQVGGFIILGPAAAAIPKLKGHYRWHIVAKALKEKDPSGHRLHTALRKTIEAFGSLSIAKSRSVKMIIDVDPQGLM